MNNRYRVTRAQHLLGKYHVFGEHVWGIQDTHDGRFYPFWDYGFAMDAALKCHAGTKRIDEFLPSPNYIIRPRGGARV